MTALLPFFFAWVDSDQKTFDPTTMNVMDEAIFSINLKHEEGQVPDLEIVIFNPRVGLLAPGRKQWAWLSYQPPDAATVTAINAKFGTSYTYPCILPIFFGELVGIPSDLFAEKITLKLISRSRNFIEDKQAVAETLKVAPNYDPIFLDETHRDEPDAILEGWSSLYHTDRTTLATSASDILTGEDGTIVFEQGDAFYDSVKMTVGESPLTNIRIEASVNWTQRSSGYVDGPNVNIISYTGDSFMGDWPKPGAGVGGGWHVETSFVNDVYKITQTPTVNISASWTTTSTQMEDCSVNSTHNSASFPALLSPSPLSTTLTWHEVVGDCNPFSTPPVNRGASMELTGLTVPLWALNCTWTLRYDAKRSYSEMLVMDVAANTQAILTSPTVEQNTELMKVSGTDVGQPLIIYDAWSDFASAPVGVTQLIFPNDATTPGGLSYQICVQAGTAGATEPVFSDIPGTITDDGTVQWASLGESPLNAIQQMTFATHYASGTILLYQEQIFDPNTGGLIDVPGATSYWLCVGACSTTDQYTEMTYIPPVTTSDEPTPAPVTVYLEWFSPSGANMGGSSLIGGGIGGGQFSSGGAGVAALGGFTDLGIAPSFLGIPIGGTADNVTANNFFPSDRGQQSIQYLICKARARLRLRSRAVKVMWDCPFYAVAGMSCRMNATLFDPRLPGGTATGKITSYTMSASEGKMIGHIEAGCAVGYGGVVEAIVGTPEYVADNTYVGTGVYQVYDGATTAVFPTDSNDISYTPPGYVPYDDGLSFPLSYLPANVSISGSASAQATAIKAAFPLAAQLAQTSVILNQTYTSTETGMDGSTTTTTNSGGTASADWWLEQLEFYDTAHSIPYIMESNPVSAEILIQPVTNGPFNAAYTVTVSPLEIPLGIDLEAPSSP